MKISYVKCKSYLLSERVHLCVCICVRDRERESSAVFGLHGLSQRNKFPYCLYCLYFIFFSLSYFFALNPMQIFSCVLSAQFIIFLYTGRAVAQSPSSYPDGLAADINRVMWGSLVDTVPLGRVFWNTSISPGSFFFVSTAPHSLFILSAMLHSLDTDCVGK
jgi:hypothetical protein